MRENVAINIHSAFTLGAMHAILFPHLTQVLVELKESVTNIAKGVEVSPYKELLNY